MLRVLAQERQVGGRRLQEGAALAAEEEADAPAPRIRAAGTHPHQLAALAERGQLRRVVGRQAQRQHVALPDTPDDGCGAQLLDHLAQRTATAEPRLRV